MTAVKERAVSKVASLAPKRPEINVEVKTRTDVGLGVIEVIVQVDDQPAGSSLVLTSPRDFAFRKSG